MRGGISFSRTCNIPNLEQENINIFGKKQNASEHIAAWPFQKLFGLNVCFVRILIRFDAYSNKSQSV